MFRSLTVFALFASAAAYCGTSGYGGPCCNKDGVPLCLDGKAWDGKIGEKYADKAAVESSCAGSSAPGKCPPGMSSASGTGNPLTCSGECSKGCEQKSVQTLVDSAKKMFESSDQMTYKGCDSKTQEYKYEVAGTAQTAPMGSNGNANSIGLGTACIDGNYYFVAMGGKGSEDWAALKEGKLEKVLLKCLVMEGGSGGSDSETDEASPKAVVGFVSLIALFVSMARIF